MTNTHRVIYVAANVGQAYALKNLLAEHGIESYVSNETLNSVHFAPADMLVGLAGGTGLHNTAPRVVVLEKDAEEARRIALDAEDAVLEGRPSPELEQLEKEIPEDTPWPACPSCNRPRLASCPICQTAGTDFPEAFLPDDAPGADADKPTLLVICPTCDEPFTPQFPARCEWCGYRFADGHDPPSVDLRTLPPFLTGEMNTRAGAVILVLIALAALVVGWFYYVLNYSGG